jgi:hypothetical protein
VTPPSAETRVRAPWLSLLLSGVLPFVVYQVLTRQGASVVTALAWAMIFPAIDIVLGLVRTRRVDFIGAAALFFLAVSIVVALLTDEPLIVLLRPAVTTGIFGLICFGSLWVRRPILYYLSRQFVATQDRTWAESFPELWQTESEFRTGIRRLTIAWGAWLLLNAAARTVLVLFLDVGTFLAVWPIASNLGMIAMVAWSISYGQKTLPRAPRSVAA